MLAVSDSSPLISLARIGKLELLRTLFPKILIPPEVYAEVVVSGFGLPGATQVAQAEWIQIANRCNGAPVFASSTSGLGIGELAAISLAKEIAASVLLIDEHRVRRLAISEGLPVMGCIGILETLPCRSLLPDLRDAYILLLAERIRLDIRMMQSSLARLSLPPH